MGADIFQVWMPSMWQSSGLTINIDGDQIFFKSPIIWNHYVLKTNNKQTNFDTPKSIYSKMNIYYPLSYYINASACSIVMFWYATMELSAVRTDQSILSSMAKTSQRLVGQVQT